MAYLKQRKGSNIWSVCYIDAETGERTQKSTGFRVDDEQETRKARALESELTRREYERGTQTEVELWGAWVPDFLRRKVKGRSYERYVAGWEQVYAYLREVGCNRPRDLTYSIALGFVKWRTSQKRRTSKKNIKWNTALNDLKVLRIVMREAVHFEFVTGNCCDRMGLEKEEVAEKPDFTDQDVADVRAKLAKWVEKPDDDPRHRDRRWMIPCFEIALNTGCRHQDTEIDMRNVDLPRNTITFPAPKGGKKRAFTIPLPTALVPMFTKLKAEGAAKTFTIPAVSGKKWWDFFKANFKGRDFCFHCTRVTYITKLCRAGVPEWVAMKLVNHASALIHRIYKRLGVEDVRGWNDSVLFEVLPPTKPQSEASAAPGPCATQPLLSA